MRQHVNGVWFWLAIGNVMTIYNGGIQDLLGS